MQSMRTDSRRSRNPLLSMLTVATLAASFALPAFAHAYLERARPIAGSVVRESPPELTLWFTQRIEPAFSDVRVLDGAGTRLAAGSPQLDTGDHKVLRVSLPKLAAGSYRVKWRVVSVDSHVSEGEFAFDVAR
jgi:methionine-rich copper-binding protein CopC